MILDLHRQGLSVSAIALQLGIDRKTVRKYLARGLEAPVYGPRQLRPRRIDPFVPYLRERVEAWPGLTGRRLFRELKERGYQGGYTAVTDALRDLRPPAAPPFEVRFETPPGDQAQVDFAQFQVAFADEPGVTRIVWLFSLVLGYSRLLWARFVLHQDLQTVLRCHLAAFTALNGVPRQILYDRMKTAVTGENAQGHIVYNRALVDFSRHHGFHPKACQPYRAKTKGKVERPYRYIREDFFLARSFRNLDDLKPSCAIGSIRSPTREPTLPPAGSSPRPSPRSSRSCSRCHWCRSARFSGSNGASPMRAWSASAATTTACPIPPADVSSRCMRSPTRSRSSRPAS
jgi:transposase